LNWNIDALPTNGDDVMIPDVGTTGPSVTIASNGIVAIKSLTAAEHLRIDGGTFSVLQTPVMSGNVTVNGGVYLPQNVNNANAVTVANGATLAATGIPSSGLVSLWHGDGNASDSVDGNTGTFTNGATTAPGRVGSTFRLDGVDDTVQIADATNLRPSSLTISVWINFNSTPSGIEVFVARSSC
jgi:hypothetical protein